MKDAHQVPKGIEPLFFTPNGKEIFNLIIDSNISEKEPHQFLQKKEIIEDIEKRGALSEFFQLKDRIKAYDGPEILLVYDPKEQYKKAFFLCLSSEMKEGEIQKLEYRRQLEHLQRRRAGLEPNKDENGNWLSWGSDIEIEEARFTPSRALLSAEVTCMIGAFKKGIVLSDSDLQEGVIECTPFKNAKFDLTRLEIDRGVQAIRETNERGAQTVRYRKVNKGLNTQPIDISDAEKESIIKSKVFRDFLERINDDIEMCLSQNETFDVFEPDFDEFDGKDFSMRGKGDYTLKELQTLTTHQEGISISAVDWNSHTINGGLMVAVALNSGKSFTNRIESEKMALGSFVLVWSLLDSMRPQYILDAPFHLTAFKWCPTMKSVGIGGLENGQIIFWDLIEKKETTKHAERARKLEDKNKKNSEFIDKKNSLEPVIVAFSVTSELNNSHCRPISSILWIPSSEKVDSKGMLIPNTTQPTQFITLSTDGTIKVWELPLSSQPNNEWIPCCSIELNFTHDSVRVPFSPTCISLLDQTTIENLVIGSVEGIICVFNWTSKECKLISKEYPSSFGTVTDISVSPLIPNFFAASNNFSVSLWKFGVKSKLIETPFSTSFSTAILFSPTHPGVFFVGKADGKLECWNINDKAHGPIAVQSIGNGALQSMSLFVQGSDYNNSLLAIGDGLGTLHILEVPKHLMRSTHADVQVVKNIIKRETNRIEKESFIMLPEDESYQSLPKDSSLSDTTAQNFESGFSNEELESVLRNFHETESLLKGKLATVNL